MPTYLDEKRRRIRQFADYLRLMGLRAHKVVKDSSFIIFDEAPPEDAESPKLKESVAIKADCLAVGGSASGGSGGAVGLPKHGKPRKRRSRYIQFAFMRDCFYMELPNNTVFPQEAEQIFRCRQGFYWAKKRPDLRWVRSNWEDIAEMGAIAENIPLPGRGICRRRHGLHPFPDLALPCRFAALRQGGIVPYQAPF